MKQTLKQILAVGAISLASVMPMEQTEAANAYVKFVQPVKGENKSYLEPGMFYKLPGDVDVFSWVDIDQKGGYYGESNFKKKINSKLNAKAQLNHPNSLMGRLGLGASINVPFLPKNAFAEITALPIFFNKDGQTIDRKEINYFVKIDLPYGIEASSFGEIIQENGGETKWGYGEIKIEKEIGNSGIKIGYNPALRNQGEGRMTPKVEHRISISANF